MKLYFVTCEGRGILNPGERGFRSLDKARTLLAKERKACSWQCMTDGSEAHPGKGDFRCGVLSPHGIVIQVSEDGRWVTSDVYDNLEPETEPTVQARNLRRADWHLNVVVDRGTGYLADGDTDLYYTGPELTEDGWQSIADSIASGDDLVEWTLTPLKQGRYHHLTGEHDDYPIVWTSGYGR